MQPAKGTTVFYTDDNKAQWPLIVCELHDDSISGWAFESGRTHYYRKVQESREPTEKHWQRTMRDERFGQTVDKP